MTTICRDGIFLSPTLCMIPADSLQDGEDDLRAHINERRQAMLRNTIESVPEQYRRLNEETRLRFQRGFYNYAKRKVLMDEKARPEDLETQQRIFDTASSLEAEWLKSGALQPPPEPQPLNTSQAPDAQKDPLNFTI